MQVRSSTRRVSALASRTNRCHPHVISMVHAGHQRLYHLETRTSPSGSHLSPDFFQSSQQIRSRTFVPTQFRQNHIPEFRTTASSKQDQGSQESLDSARISDHEYQVRVGKACRVIVGTLPDFMARGIVDLDDLVTSPSSSTTSSSKPGFMRSLPFLNQATLKRAIWGSQAEASAHQSRSFDSLYHPSIAFEFRPPIPALGLGKDNHLSEPPKSDESRNQLTDLHRGGPTICFNGRTVYTTSAHILRHALAALFYDITLHLDSARFEGRSRTASTWSDISSYLRRHSESPEPEDKSSSTGRDRLVIRLRFEGISRVTLQPHTYTVIFKYDFDRQSGTVNRHVVDNIQPIPGSKVWAGLTNAWGTLSPVGAGRGGAAHYEGFALPQEMTPSNPCFRYFSVKDVKAQIPHPRHRSSVHRASYVHL